MEGAQFQKILKFFDRTWHWEHVSRHWTNEVCKLNCCYDDKEYASSLKTQEIALDGSGGKYGFYIKLMSDEDLVLRYIQRNVE